MSNEVLQQDKSDKCKLQKCRNQNSVDCAPKLQKCQRTRMTVQVLSVSQNNDGVTEDEYRMTQLYIAERANACTEFASRGFG